MTETMIALKDIGETIKVGDRVGLIKLFASNKFYFSEYLDGWYTCDKECREFKTDDTKKIEHYIDAEELYKYFRELKYEETIFGVCECCERNILVGEKYLIHEDDENRDEIICSDCYEEHTVTSYFVGGEFLGDENEGWQVEEAE